MPPCTGGEDGGINEARRRGELMLQPSDRLHQRRAKSKSGSSEPKDGNEEAAEAALSVKDLCGSFILHTIIMVVAVIFWVARNFRRLKEAAPDMTMTERQRYETIEGTLRKNSEAPDVLLAASKEQANSETERSKRIDKLDDRMDKLEELFISFLHTLPFAAAKRQPFRNAVPLSPTSMSPGGSPREDLQQRSQVQTLILPSSMYLAEHISSTREDGVGPRWRPHSQTFPTDGSGSSSSSSQQDAW